MSRYFALSLLLLTSAACAGKRATDGDARLPMEDAGPGAPDPRDAATDASASREQLCGADGEVCCGPPRPACMPDLRCSDGVCVQADAGSGRRRLCQTTSDCGAGQSCCPGGFLGTCEPLEQSSCPLPDLTLIHSRYTNLSLGLVEPGSGSCSPSCVTGPGRRRVLGFSFDGPQPINVGNADFILGDPRTSPGFIRSCDGQQYLEKYLRYELLDAGGNVLTRVEVQPWCATGYDNPATPEYEYEVPQPFNCDFWGLEAGFVAAQMSGYSYSSYGCTGLDVTDVPAGTYLLRATVNPDHVFVESDYDNNSVVQRVTLPSYDTPTQRCAGDAAILSQLPGAECGWVAGPSRSCTPGESVTFDCGCAEMIYVRVCDGTRPCSAIEALALGSSGYLADGSVECPALEFTCPAGGSFSTLIATESYYSGPVDLGVCAPAAAGADAGTSALP